ncbi:MAG: AbrB/MazE/SpoVT family DNA-binding domain-containing protein [Bacillota bacterium]
MYTVIVSSRGQIVIPVEARKELGIKEGDILHVHVEDGGRIVMKMIRKNKKQKGIVDQTAGLLSEMEVCGKDYVEGIRSGSDRRLDDIEGSY